MIKRLIGISIIAVVLFGAFGLTGCEQASTREEVISYIEKLYEAKELKFISEPNAEHSDSIETSIQKYDSDGKLVYMYNKSVHRDTDEITSENLYQNGKKFDINVKKYQEVNYTRQIAFGSKVPLIGFLELESTTFEKKSNNEYFIVVDPQSLIGDMFGDMVFEYTIKVTGNFISEISFGSNTNGIAYITTISRDIGQQITIDESEFTRWSLYD